MPDIFRILQVSQRGLYRGLHGLGWIEIGTGIGVHWRQRQLEIRTEGVEVNWRDRANEVGRLVDRLG